MLLLISERVMSPPISFRRSHLIGPSAIFSEHVALPNIEAYISLSPKWEHALSCSPLGLPLQLRYMKLNQDKTIWDKKWSAIWEHRREHNGNLGNTLGRNKRQTTPPLSWLLDITNNILYIDNLFSGWMLIIIIHAQKMDMNHFSSTHTRKQAKS
jgi:hypothetical protein